MSKKCAKCEKTVYPIEELKCLDKIWHKTCFRCWECGMALNMKNYKGYDKRPYCNAHYPKTKHTEVAETPEMARLAANTKIQSNIAYHGAFEKAKGHYTAIADDPETMRHLRNMEKISSVKYHEDFEKTMKGKKISVTDDPESARLKENMKVISQVQYKGLNEKQAEMETRRPMMNKEPSPVPQAVPHQQAAHHPPAAHQQIAGYQPEEHKPSPYSARNQGSTTIYNSSQGGKVETAAARRVGSITDYDPMNDQWGSITHPGYGPSRGQNQRQSWEETIPAPPAAAAAPPQRKEPAQQAYYPPPSHAAEPQYVPPPQAEPAPPQPLPPTSMPAKAAGPVYQAMYDYEAGDDDEVGFCDGDRIIEVEPIDDGWMFGTVQRTGQRGMLPANYVERVQ